jgi:nucleoside-triphosphatase THEP1
MSIYIFSRPVHSGKTSVLLSWCNYQKNIRGILMPDINGSRKILDIHSKEVFDIECPDPLNTKEPLTTVGRFHFYTAAFERANAILMRALSQNPDWLIIDESGKLELEGLGFNNSIKKAVELYNTSDHVGNLLITVRDSLCEKTIEFFNLKNYQVIHDLEFRK